MTGGRRRTMVRVPRKEPELATMTEKQGARSEQSPVVLEPYALDALLAALRERGYRTIGPTVRDGAIVHDELRSADELPIGWRDVQEPGSYRLERRADEARFGYAVGPQAWKRELFPPRLRLWRAHRDERDGFELTEDEPPETPVAFFGVRPCELAAIRIQDRVFLGGRWVDRDYQARRSNVFVVAVNCGEPAATCFCTSTGSGPEAGGGYDILLTEVLAEPHRFVAEAGSDAGAEVLLAVPSRPADEADLAAARTVVDAAAARIAPAFDSESTRRGLLDNLEHPRFAELAERCLSCGNCTLVCPTCFCTTVEDTNDLATSETERWRVWDTCFSVQYSEMHGGGTRPSPRSRYRQWLIHKLATWPEQFGTLGCVGCGRCVTWCPVGIDIREEARAIAEEEER
jgi:ferredoxin